MTVQNHDSVIKKPLVKKWWFWLIAFFAIIMFFKVRSSVSDWKKSFPKKAQTHIVELYKVQLSDFDLNSSSFGNPLDIEVRLLENGEKIKSVLLSGKRGERYLDTPIKWIINFNPTSNYQLIVEEISIIAKAMSWKIPGTPKIGYWPIGRNKGKINFGKESILFFRDKIAN